MRKFLVGLFSLSLLISVMVAPVAAGAPPLDVPPQTNNVDDSLSNPLADAQLAARQQALQLVLQGKETPTGANAVVGLDTAVATAGSGSNRNQVRYNRKREFVELARVGEDTIWTVLGEFGTAPATHNHGTLGTINHAGDPGPSHNQIPRPNRRLDNSSIWVSNFSEQHYEKLLFSEEKGRVSMRNYYIEQSSGSYAVNGDVTNWVQVPFNEAAYGSNYCGDNVCADTWRFVQDSLNAWYAREIASGKSLAQVEAYLAQFDVWDRYDYDLDGNFDESDGYIDHFQSVHAGSGEEVGGGAQGEDAIWSHRWYVQLTPIGAGGPVGFAPFGGTRIGQTNLWVGDYTIEPEDGGVGVFAHEFAHDLGIPDLYDTAGGENSTGFWTLMSSGSYGNSGKPEDGLGSKPTHMGVYEKFQLGWLGDNPADGGFDVFGHDETARFRMGPSMHRSEDGVQSAFVLLPDKPVASDVGDPFAGEHFYYSGAGPDLDNVMYKAFDFSAIAAATPIPVTAQVNYDIELDWDYAYLVASTDGGANWTGVHTNLSTNTSPNGQNFGEGITGTTDGLYVPLTADLTAYAGQANVLVGFRYWTDAFENPPGFMVDEISINGTGPFGAEDVAADGFTFDPVDGFHATTGEESSLVFNAYVLEYRQYNGFDQSLKTGPYNFGFLDNPNRQNWVEHFPYQDGLLISYWNAEYDPGDPGGLDIDNNTSEHPGAGFLLPIDAHPVPMFNAQGDPWRARVQSYDSTFGTEKTDRIKLHVNSEESIHPSQKAVSLFDDSRRYWNPASPLAGVQVPNHGVQIQAGNTGGFYMWVDLNP